MIFEFIGRSKSIVFQQNLWRFWKFYKKAVELLLYINSAVSSLFLIFNSSLQTLKLKLYFSFLKSQITINIFCMQFLATLSALLAAVVAAFVMYQENRTRYIVYLCLAIRSTFVDEIGASSGRSQLSFYPGAVGRIYTCMRVVCNYCSLNVLKMVSSSFTC